MPHYELSTLGSYDDTSLIEEMRRVIDALPPGPVTRSSFDEIARVSSSTLIKRFGGWHEALRTAGRAERYGGRTVSAKMRAQHIRRLTNDELIAELQNADSTLGVQTLTMKQFNQVSTCANASGVKRRFGSWKAALEEAGLKLSPLGRRYSEDQYFENILAVWTHYGRQPKYREMNAAPSEISAGGYEAKFGGWRKALAAFVRYIDSDRDDRETKQIVQPEDSAKLPSRTVEPPRVRSIPLSLRYDVLRRDNFKCVLCGASPATDPTTKLHVDHIEPFSHGGPTEFTNLRTLCSHCNIGKSDKVESD